ncbi:putative 2-oxoglutarate dehydrogenase E1 component DHKTD1, mitochondrial, partial [Goodea atripinnis]
HGLARLVEAYRTHGHKAAKINPLLPQQPVGDSVPEIDVLASAVRGTLNTSGMFRRDLQNIMSVHSFSS